MRALHNSYLLRFITYPQSIVQTMRAPGHLRLREEALAMQAHGVECFGQCRRCVRSGGDFLEILAPNPDELMVGIGNVPANGMSGSILLSGWQATLQSLGSRGRELPEVVGELNRMLWEIGPEDITAGLFCARIDPRNRRIHYVNAGHPAAILIRSDGRAERLEPHAAAAGLSRRSTYTQRAIRFEPGDTLIAFTEGAEDGVHSILRGGLPGRVRDLPYMAIQAAEWAGISEAADRTVVTAHFNRAEGYAAGPPPATLCMPSPGVAASA